MSNSLWPVCRPAGRGRGSLVTTDTPLLAVTRTFLGNTELSATQHLLIPLLRRHGRASDFKFQPRYCSSGGQAVFNTVFAPGPHLGGTTLQSQTRNQPAPKQRKAKGQTAGKCCRFLKFF